MVEFKPKTRVVIRKKDGSPQHYWVTDESITKLKRKGVEIEKVGSPAAPPLGKFPELYEEDFIKNFIEKDAAGLRFGPDVYETQLYARVEIKKNGKVIMELPLKVDRNKLARSVLDKLIYG